VTAQRRCLQLALVATVLTAGCGRGLGLRPGEEPATEGDGGTEDGAALDLAQPIGDADAAAPPAPCPTAAHCWSFEDDSVGNTPGPPWQVIPGIQLQGNQPRTEVAVRAPGEGHAVHLTGLGQAFARMRLDTARVDPLLAAEHHGRMMVWLETTPGDQWMLLEAGGKLEEEGYTAYGYGAHAAAVQSYYGGQFDCERNSSKLLPTKRWACLEWHFKGPTPADGGAGLMELWIDGCPVADAAASGASASVCDDQMTHTWRAPSFDSLELGVASFVPSDIPFSLWIDDVALAPGPSRLGCPGPPPACTTAQALPRWSRPR
jgi:hypothetical protein